jgi:hypothetical protein
VFIHHFGSRSFAANGVDYSSTMNENWAKFAKKWGMSGPLPLEGYRGGTAHGRGFIREEHYIPFPQPRVLEPEPGEPAEAAAALERARIIFGIAVRSEGDWSEAAQFVRRFALAFNLEDGVALEIAAFGDPPAYTIATRVERILEKAEISPKDCPDIDIADYDDDEEWSVIAGDRRFVDVSSLADRSPSALRRLIGAHAG